MSQVLTSVVAYFATVLLLWGLTFSDEKVRGLWKRPIGIFIRMALLFGVLHTFLVPFPMELWQSYMVLLILIAFSFAGQFFDFDLLIVVILFWLLYQWAFWFPVRDEVVLKNVVEPKEKPETDDLPRHGVAITDLKPMGKILIAGKERIAISTLGFVSSGDQVLVEGFNGNEFRVRKNVETNRDRSHGS